MHKINGQMRSIKRKKDSGNSCNSIAVNEAKQTSSILTNKNVNISTTHSRPKHDFGQIPLHNPDAILQTKRSINTPGDKYEQEADAMADKVTQTNNEEDISQPKPVLSLITPLVQTKAEGTTPSVSTALNNKISSSLGSGSSMDKETGSFMSKKFGTDFSNVKIHTDNEAAKMNKQLNAKAFTVGRDIYFNAGELNPQSNQVKQLLAHELTHVAQQNSEKLIMRKSLGDLPETTRKSLKISEISPGQPKIDEWIKEYFDPTSHDSVESEMKIEFGTGITDAKLQKGLRNIALELLMLSEEHVTPATDDSPEVRRQIDPKTWVLPPNSIIDLAMDLSSSGGDNAIFRFTRYKDGKEEKVLVEKTHVIAPSVPAKTPGAAASFTGTVTVKNVKVTIDSSFGNDRGKVVVEAIELIPDPIRPEIDGVKINFMGTGSGPKGQKGEYKEDEDRVRIWDDMFKDSPKRVGESTFAISQVVHELAHAVDLRSLFKAQNARDAAQIRVKEIKAELMKVSLSTVDSLGGDDAKTKAAKTGLEAEQAKLQIEIAEQTKLIPSAKSVAGSELGDRKLTELLTTGFGKALAADGVKPVKGARKRNASLTSGAIKEKTLATGISDYANTDLMEAFAENFEVYILDEELLKTIRPKTYAFFVKTYPKATAKP